MRKIRTSWHVRVLQMQHYWFPLLLLGLTACAPSPIGSKVTSTVASKTSALPDLGQAPELTNTVWLNSDSALRLADLRGKVVGLEM